MAKPLLDGPSNTTLRAGGFSSIGSSLCGHSRKAVESGGGAQPITDRGHSRADSLDKAMDVRTPRAIAD